MAKKKKEQVSNKEVVKKETTKKKAYKPGDELFVDFKDLPGNVLGKLYDYDGVKARLVYINEKSKLIVE